MSEAMIELGMACDGGKDSLSMAAMAGNETVKAPGQLVISAYAPCPDITGELVISADTSCPPTPRALRFTRASVASRTIATTQ